MRKLRGSLGLQEVNATKKREARNAFSKCLRISDELRLVGNKTASALFPTRRSSWARNGLIMREVLPNKLWVGNAHDIRPWSGTLSDQISAVVDLAVNEPPAEPPHESIYLRIPLVDSASNEKESFRLALRTVVELLRDEVPVLVCCSAGLSRSPSIACGAVALYQNVEADHVLKEHFRDLPHDIAPALWERVKEEVADMT